MKTLFPALLFLTLLTSPARAQSPLTWQIVYHGNFVSQKADFTILDLFLYSPEQILREVRPIAYFSAHFEPYRPDSHLFGKMLGKIPGWPDEKYIEWTDPKNQKVMLNRLRLAKEKGFLAVDIDNVDGPGTLPYFTWLLQEAKALGLRVGLKNAVEVLPQVGHEVDFFVSEASSLDEMTCYEKYRKPVVRMFYGKGAATPGFIHQAGSGQAGNRF